MDEVKTNNNFQELNHEEIESVGGGFHFAVGVIREGQSVANVGLNLFSAIADATDSVLNRATGCFRSARSSEPIESNGSGLFGGVFRRRW